MTYEKRTNDCTLSKCISLLSAIIYIVLIFMVQGGSSQVYVSSNTIPENVNNDVMLFNLTSVLPNYAYVINGNSANVSSMFEISQSGALTLAKLLSATTRKLFDYEKFKIFEVFLTATNKGNSSDSRSVTIQLRLSDVNDEPPAFINDPTPFLAVISSSAMPGTVVYTFTVNDPDTVPSPKPNPIFSILSQLPIVRFTWSAVEGNKMSIIYSQESTLPQNIEITLTIQVQDDAGNKNTAELKVLVGQRPPQFFTTPYTGQIYETDSTNYVFKDNRQLEIKALQFQPGQSLQFRLADSAGSSFASYFTFDVQSASGNVQSIKLKNIKPIDYEQVTSMSVSVLAIDPVAQMTSTVLCSIEVMDENDNPPVFLQAQYYAKVPENLSVDQFIVAVTASDRDSGQNGKINFSTNSPYFSIATSSNGTNYIGTLSLKSPLDYDKPPGPFYAFNVTATDSGTDPRTTSVPVLVTATNVNDNAPVFDNGTRTFSLLDTSTPNAVVSIIQASDADGDGIKFYFLGMSDSYEIFKIVQQSGVILLNSSIPREKDVYLLTVLAVDDGRCCGGLPSLTSTATFTVNIIDANTHKPTFTNCSSYDRLASVKELSAPGTPAFQVSAYDPDRGENGRVVYMINTPNPSETNAPFQINSSTGMIYVKGTIMRDQNGYIQVTVVGSNPTPNVMEGWCTFRMNIIDINNNPPVFSQPQYEATISISAPKNSIVIQMLATDKDAAENANITYSFVNSSNMFSIDSISGVVRLSGNLQGETSFKLVVLANDNGKDPGPLNSTAVLVINVNNEGKTPPSFINLPANLSFSIGESDPAGSLITSFSCTSNDLTAPQVEFLVLDGETSTDSNAFGPQPVVGSSPPAMKLVLKPNANLDYATKKQYRLSVVCQTLSSITLRQVINPVVNVQDSNNQVPVFEGLDSLGRYPGSVAENSDIGSPVIQVLASDKDEVAAFRTVTFTLLDNTDLFRIDNEGNNRATMYTKKVFDREVKDFYLVQIQAQDGANAANSDKPNTVTRYIYVKITDVNDNAPNFSNTTTNSFNISESAEINTVVGIVTATDVDSIDNSNLNYRFTAETNVNNAFSILAGTGQIRVARKLDYENPNEPKNYNLILIATDFNQLHSATTSVTISVIDENDNTPEFNPNIYEVQGVVTEEDTSVTSQNPKFLVRVNATDKDISRPQTDIRYTLKTDNNNNLVNFTINSHTGEVFLTGALDRDKPNPTYSITVVAEDERINPRLGYATVNVLPMDINDNSPVFVDAFLKGNVLENPPIGTLCMNVLARDIDYGANGTVSYQISSSQPEPNRASLFAINSALGSVTTRGPPDQYDRETVKVMYLAVEAYDGGNPSLTSTATVTITIIDVNDQSPYFAKPLYTATMSEATQSGNILFVPAIDLDDDPRNKELQFTLLGSPGTKFFFVTTLDQQANIQVSKPVDYETDPHVFNMTLNVTDGMTGHTNQTQVQIFITDYNDNPPKFNESSISVTMVEELPSGTVVATFSAKDADEGINAEFDFTILRTSDPRYEFYIHPKTGVVTTRKPLDREYSDRREVTIVATDKGEIPLSSQAKLYVTLTDINDNAPSFKENYRPELEENENYVNKLVKEIYATDPDTPINGPPFGFSLPKDCNVPACQYFTLTFNPSGDNNQGTATIKTTTVTFDREQAKSYLLPIVMWDRNNKNGSMTATNTLTIIIRDKNDNDMKPGHQNIWVYNYQGNFSDVEIGRVYVDDPDDWDLPDKTFNNLQPATLQNYFSVAPDTGMISMKKDVPVGTYDFQVSVFDKKFSSTVIGSVTVTVNQLSDEAVRKSGSVRLKDITAEDFIKTSGTGTAATSAFDRFREKLANLLGYASKDNIDIVSLNDGDGYLDVRFSAHGSPYWNPSQTESAMMLNQDDFEKNVGVKIDQLPINLCMDELYDDGCYSDFNFAGQPFLINSNGTSYLLMKTEESAEAGCIDSIFPEPETCRGDYCYNGGTCVLDDWKKLSCNCTPGYDGPRCQQRRHSFDGNSIAFYDSLSVCSEGRTSIDFITTQPDGVILYTGPLDPNVKGDYLSLELKGGLPVLKINLGTEEKSFSLQSTSTTLNDGKWHHIDIDRDNQNVVMTVDHCETAINSAVNGTVSMDKWKTCRSSDTIPGPDVLLNVQAFLQLGGQYKSTSAVRFNGCLRNLVHNTKLYDLSFNIPKWNSGKNNCPIEDNVCGESVCGLHASCQSVWKPTIQKSSCRCAPGYYGNLCDKVATVIDLKQQSYLKWSVPASVITQAEKIMSFQMMFRTRKNSGTLFLLTNAVQYTILLQLDSGRLSLVYNMGNGEKKLPLANATANNGQWHTIRMERYGSEFLLSLDGGEGRNYNYQVAIPEITVFFKMLTFFSVGGRIPPVDTTPTSVVDDLVSTCVQDIRLNDYYLPMLRSQNSESASGITLYDNKTTVEGCTRDDCTGITCGLNQVCYPLWEKYECRCDSGFVFEGPSCVSICKNSPCLNGGTCIPKDNQVDCVCPAGYSGAFCGTMALVEDSGLSDGAIAGIVIACIVLLILLILLLIFFCCIRRRPEEKEKFVLEVDPDDDYIRENVMFYDEEGAGEEDHRGYDLTLLQKPSMETSGRPNMYPDKIDEMSRRNAPRPTAQPRLDRPDVGSFIDNRIKDAEDDDPLADSTREFDYEGGNSDAGSLSSLNTSSSDASQDYDYLSGWGPKFAKLADMYGAGQNLESS